MLSSLLALVVSAAPQAAAVQPSPPAAQPTPLLVTATNPPLRVLGSDGTEHLENDIIMTNVLHGPADPDRR
jgi:hypothetical protein